MSAGQARADEQEIRALLESRLTALRSKDASQVVAASDPAIVKFDFAPPLRNTGAAVLDPTGLQWWLDTWDGEIIAEMAELTIVSSGDVAFCHYLGHLKGVRADGAAEDTWTRSTLGLQQIDGAWKVTHEHNSAPFYMDGSDRAALDLQP